MLKVFVHLLQVKDVLFEPVRKTQDAMFFFESPEGMWIPCGPKQQGAKQITMQDLATKGLASQVFKMLQIFITVESRTSQNDNWYLRVYMLLFSIQILPPPISRTDFDKVLARQKPTVSKSDLEVHERFTKEFGEEG